MPAELQGVGQPAITITEEPVSASFELQAKELFGVTPPVLNEAYFASQIKQLDSLLPGEGANGSNDFVVSIHWF